MRKQASKQANKAGKKEGKKEVCISQENLRPKECYFIKRDTPNTGIFPVNITKYLRTHILKKTKNGCFL